MVLQFTEREGEREEKQRQGSKEGTDSEMSVAEKRYGEEIEVKYRSREESDSEGCDPLASDFDNFANSIAR